MCSDRAHISTQRMKVERNWRLNFSSHFARLGRGRKIKFLISAACSSMYTHAIQCLSLFVLDKMIMFHETFPHIFKHNSSAVVRLSTTSFRLRAWLCMNLKIEKLSFFYCFSLRLLRTEENGKLFFFFPHIMPHIMMALCRIPDRDIDIDILYFSKA